MDNSVTENLITYNNEAVLNIESTATFLGISTATVRNWVKCGYLQTFGENTKYFFHKKDIEDVKFKIFNGDLKKLNKRANKTGADKTFIPDEYMQDKTSFENLNSIVNFVKNNNIELLPALLLVTLNLLKREKIISTVTIYDVIQKKELYITNEQIQKEIKIWFSEVKDGAIKKTFSFLLDCNIPKQRDALGFLYQSLLNEG